MELGLISSASGLYMAHNLEIAVWFIITFCRSFVKPCIALHKPRANNSGLSLNIWTSRINEGGGKPVMIWKHGGAMAFGSATELVGYEADRLCRDEDVVVVSVNHRLNLLGYMNLTEFGQRYAHTGTTNLNM